VVKVRCEYICKVIACFGTVHILNMEYQSHDVERAVDEISCAVGELKNICDRLHMKRGLFLQPVKRRWAWLRNVGGTNEVHCTIQLTGVGKMADDGRCICVYDVKTVRQYIRYAELRDKVQFVRQRSSKGFASRG